MTKLLSFTKRAIHFIWLHYFIYYITPLRQKIFLYRAKKKQIHVVFTALDRPMWRYQHIYELLKNDNRFCVDIVFTPSPLRNAEKDMNGLREYFDNKKIKYIDVDKNNKPIDIKKALNPDIIFYTQPYDDLLVPEQDYHNFTNRLICYMPYAFWTATGECSYNLPFHNLAWRLYYSSPMHKEDAKRLADNHGRNVRVVGYANSDDYLKKHHPSPWKDIFDKKKRKKIIWAPHFTITSDSVFQSRSNFLWMADLMIDIAEEYKDKIQIAFKPHPFLLSQLYNHKDWGRDRTDKYYNKWSSMYNTQLETGEYIDLFMNSDAMIHDCYSFTVEYHYTNNPVLFITNNKNIIRNGINDFGKIAFDLQYIGKNISDIKKFIDETVINGLDPMKNERQDFINKHLLPPDGKSSAQNVYDDLVESLF